MQSCVNFIMKARFRSHSYIKKVLSLLGHALANNVLSLLNHAQAALRRFSVRLAATGSVEGKGPKIEDKMLFPAPALSIAIQSDFDPFKGRTFWAPLGL